MEFFNRLLDDREKRYLEQEMLVGKYKKPIISFMVNIPGVEKVNNKIRKFHKMGIEIIEKEIGDKIIYKIYKDKNTGIYYLASVDMDSKDLKYKMIDIEERDIGRLFDIDVFDENFNQITRKNLGISPRKCLICNDFAKVCIVTKKHSYEDLVKKTNEIIEYYINKNSDLD